MSPLVCTSAMGAKKVKVNQERPNVIIILADDLGYGDLGCYGAKNVQTPNVDKLAKQGIRFTDAHAIASTSTPSRYSLLTGEYAWRKPGTDVAPGDAGMIIKPSQFTMADMFKSVGYTTCAIGKWHLGLGAETGKQDWNAPLPAALADIGFDYHYIMAATADRVPCVYIENGKVANYDPSAPIEVSYFKNFPGEPTGKDNPELCYNMKSSHGHNMSIVNGIGRIGYMKGGGKALWKDENIADSITNHAIDFIKKNSNHPFFLYFATNDVHVPRFPHERFRGKSSMGVRGDAIVQFDWSVGKIMETLDKLGIADTAIPVIVRWPMSVKPNQTSDVLMSQIDFMASFGNLIGATFPKGSAPDSKNHLGNLIGNDNTHRPWVAEMSNNHVISIRTKEWKYIEPNDGSKMIKWGPKIETGNDPNPQLYRISDNLYEQNNVAEANPKVVFEMQNILRRVK